MKASDDAKECARNIMEALEDQSCVGCKHVDGCGGEICKKDRKAVAKIVQEAIDKAYQDGYTDGYNDCGDDVLESCEGSSKDL